MLRRSASSSTVTVCSTPGGTHTARSGGTRYEPPGTVSRVTPVVEKPTCAQGCECGTTSMSVRSQCIFTRTGRAAFGT